MPYLEFKQDGVTYNLYEMPNGFVIKGDLNISFENLAELPDLSGVIVEGYFDCSSNQLTSLKGAPQKVGGNFVCYANELTTLEGAPQKVGGGFSCFNNKLTTLEYAPREIGGSFWCFDNPLTSLLKLPKMQDNASIYCNTELGDKYGLGLGEFTTKELYESSAYQNEVKIDELRQKKHKEDVEKRAKATRDTKAAFEAWLKQNGKGPSEK
jgi:hypothetical protein